MLGKFKDYIDYYEKRSESVSHWSVGKHIEHCIKSARGMVLMLEKSEGEPYKKNYSISKLAVFGLMWIPRGKAKAPSRAQPDEVVSKEALIAGINKCGNIEERIRKLDAGKHWKHDIFGELNPNETIKFIKIHNKHHEKIIKDIIKSADG